LEAAPLFEKILVAVDGSSYAEYALEYAVGMARKYCSKLVIIHAVFNSAYAYEGVLIPPDSRLDEAGREILRRSEETAKRLGIDAETRLVSGHPSGEIAKVANEEGFDLLIVGNRGLGTVKAFLLGSVSEKLSRIAKCPVLIVKPGAKDTPT
jgi:nucleotide-binding universal stress UspA family protein